jgi:hypothetical protein
VSLDRADAIIEGAAPYGFQGAGFDFAFFQLNIANSLSSENALNDTQIKTARENALQLQ